MHVATTVGPRPRPARRARPAPTIAAAALATLGLAPGAHAAAGPADLAAATGYLAALRVAVEPDPALAAGYLAFWSALADGLPAESDTAGWAAAQAAATDVTAAVRRRYGNGRTGYRLRDVLPVAVAVLPTGGSEALARLVDRHVTPRLDGGPRYGFGGSLAGMARLGAATTLWRECRQSAACATAHDTLFAPAMGGVSIRAGLVERLANDARLAREPDVAALRTALATGLGRLGGDDDRRPAALLALADGAWRLIDARPDAEPVRLRALLSVGTAAATLAGSPARADAFATLGPSLEAAAAPGAGRGSWLTVAARLGLVLAGGQALALFDGAAALRPRPGPPAGDAPPALARLVTTLYAGTARDLAALRTGIATTAAGTDAQLAALAVAIDVLKEDLDRVESAQQAQVRAAFQAAEGRRWTAFDADNERCFALRNRVAGSDRLRPAEFRRCEDRFLQGAVRRAQYVTRSTDYLLDARYLEAADLRFPFHAHYPLLLVRAGVDQRSALSLPDPVDWLQQSTALLRLYQENPAAPDDRARRAEVLRQVRAAGARLEAALDGLVTGGATSPRAWSGATSARLLDAYFASLDTLLARIDALDPATADRHGKRLTEDLDQPLPDGGTARAASDARLTVPLAPCAEAPAEAFRVPADGVVTETRRFFDDPITAADVAAAWNRERVGSLGLPPAALAAAVPPGWAWAALDGLGRLEACLLAFRPESVEWTRTPAAEPDSFVARTDLAARVVIRFVPGDALAGVAGFTPGTPVVLAAREGLRRCQFAYRRDAGGCSGAACLAQVAPALWAAPESAAVAGGSCADAPFTALLAPVAAPPLPPAVAERYWAGRQRALVTLAADVRRSTAWARATTAWREYFAYAGVALGSYADGGAALAPLLDATGPLAPDGIVRARLDGRRPAAALRQNLAAERLRLGAAADARGRDIVTTGGLPALDGLADAIGRIDVLLAAYAP